jgi:hypothetical protein
MPKAPAPEWRKRKEPILDAHLQASVDQAGGVADESGHYAPVIYAGCADRDRAKEIVQALHRSKRYVGVSMSANIVKAEDGTYQVHFKAHTKEAAKLYMLQKYGNDVSKWPYQPRAKKATT